MSGVEFSTFYLAKQLDRSEWTPLVICPEEGDLPVRCRAAGVEVAIVPRLRFFSTSLRFGGYTAVNPLALMINVFAMIASGRRLAKFLRARRAALVVPKGLIAQFYGGLAARWAGVPCVWHVQDRVSEHAGRLYPLALALAGRVLAREIIVDADSIARQLRPFISRERISVIPNGVDTTEFSPQCDGLPVRAQWDIQPDELLMGVIGRLTPWKGQHVIVHAFARMAAEFPRVRLVVVGSALFDTDEYARKLRADVERLGLGNRVIFAGFRWDLPQVLAALDIFVHTSMEKDSSPLAVASAMAAGKAIICSRVDGTAQMFEDGDDGLWWHRAMWRRWPA